MPKTPKKTCPDCKGSGKYVGFNVVVEDCRLCGGEGEVVDKAARSRKKKISKKSKKGGNPKFPRLAGSESSPQVAFDFMLDNDDDYDDDWWDDLFGLPYD